MEEERAIIDALLWLERTLGTLHAGLGGDAPPTDGWRSRARQEAARLLKASLRLPDAERDHLREIVMRLSAMVDLPYVAQEVHAFRRDVEWLQALLARPRPVRGRVLRLGTGTSDFHRMLELGDGKSIGLLGTSLTLGPEGVVVAGLLAGALAVASRGMRNRLDAGTTLTVLDRALKDTLPETAPVSMCCWSYDAEGRELRVASAGHRGVWLLRGGSFVALRPPPGEALGTATRGYTMITEPLYPGDVVVCFTPGLLDQPSPQGTLLGDKDLRLALLQGEGLQSAYFGLRGRLETHCPADQWEAEATATLWEVPQPEE